MRYRHRRIDSRIDDLEGACLPSRLKVLNVAGADRYTVLSPEAMKGVVFTKEQLDAFFKGEYDVITLHVKYEGDALPCQA